jgi:hypothetical protein
MPMLAVSEAVLVVRYYAHMRTRDAVPNVRESVKTALRPIYELGRILEAFSFLIRIPRSGPLIPRWCVFLACDLAKLRLRHFLA